MLSSHKSVMRRGLHRSPAKGVTLKSIVATTFNSRFPPETSHLLGKRNFSWGARHTLGSKHAGKVWKGFSTHDNTRSRKKLYRGSIWNDHYVLHPRPYLPVQDWRLTSSLVKTSTAHTKADKAPASSTKSKGKMEEDWYNNYQQEKKKKYDDFMKRMEDDPIGMLFGRRWASWIDGAEAKLANASASSAQRGDVPGKSQTTYWDGGNERTTISVKPPEEKYADEQPQSGTVGDQTLERDYEIDPITNRKVPKPLSRSKMPPITTVPPTTNVAPKANTSVIPETSPISIFNGIALGLGTKESFDIPVRRFVPHTNSSSPTSQTKREQTSTVAELERRETTCSQRPKSWLAQEGFGLEREIKIDAQSHISVDIKPKASDPRIESALDRHVQANNPIKTESRRLGLQYDPTENTAEDIDLLRSSDVRASAGLRGRAPRESDAEKRVRQQKLEEDYESRRKHREIRLAQEVAAKRPQQTWESRESAPKEAPSESMLKLRALKQRYDGNKATTTEWVNEISDVEATPAQKPIESIKQSAVAAITEKANKIKAQIVPLKARLDAVKADYDALRQRWLDEKHRKEEKAAKRARVMHEEEVNAQKVAMNAMEMHGVESTSKRNAAVADDIRGIKSGHKPTRRQLQSLLPGEGDMASNVHEFASRDRWYKQKAPHASDKSDAKLQRLAKDKALIQEVRGIYEDTYGIIDTNHRQPPQGEEVPKPLSTSETQASTTSGTSLPHTDSTSSSTSASSHRPSSAESLQPWKAFHASLLGNDPSSDPLAMIQKLFDELRQGQAFVQERHTSSQHYEVLAIIQKLFSELGQIQAIIKSYRTNVKEMSSSEEFATMLQTVRRACEQSKGRSPKGAGKVATFGRDVSGADGSPKFKVDRSLESTYSEPLTIYRILAFDFAKQEIVSSKATSLAPFQPLLPVESLKLLNNPDRFLPDVMTLHNMGFTIVAGTSNAVVLQKPANTQEFDDSKREQVMKGMDYVDSTSVPDRIAGACGPHMTWEDNKAMRDQQHEGPCALVPPSSASSYPPNSASPTSSTAGICSTESAAIKPGEHKPAAPSPASIMPSSNRVRREEAVFSGRSRPNWEETERRRASKKHKRAEKQFKKSRLKNVLVTGIVTAVSCYAVGVISQMMQH